MQRFFHLLSDNDLDELRGVLEWVRERRREVVARWYELYLSHFGDERALLESEFQDIFEPVLKRNQESLLGKDMEGFAADVLAMGQRLAERRVPLVELIAAMHLLEEAVQAVFPRDPPPPIALYNKFDKLSHIRIMLLVGAYSRLQSAAAATRLQAAELAERNLPPPQRTRFHGLVGCSSAMRELYQRIEVLAASHAPVMIAGEPGTGKKLVARVLHECSGRADGPFLTLRCGIMPAYLVEHEIFGYRRQRTNGAQSYLGLYAAAKGGTLFLEEAAQLPTDMQDRLVQLARYKRAAPEVRIIASTASRYEASRAINFSKHFLGLFADAALQLPPLRERRGDIALLGRHFIELLRCRMRDTAVSGLDEAAVEAMERYSWPGNIRELYETIQSALERARATLIGVADLPSKIGRIDRGGRQLSTIAFETFADAERAVLQRALEITGGNKLRAARLLKISRKKLYTGIAKYGLKPADT